MINVLNAKLRSIPAWAVYILGTLPFLWLVYLLFSGGLGVDPVKALERGVGLIGLKFLVAGLAITPLRKFLGLNLLKFRRAVGLLAFFYVSLHLTVWLALDIQFFWGEIWADIIKRPYITIGMGAFVLMIPLAVTSNNRVLSKIGPVRWRRLHALTYPVLILAGVHYALIGKVWQIQALVYLLGIVILLLTRVRFAKCCSWIWQKVTPAT